MEKLSFEDIILILVSIDLHIEKNEEYLNFYLSNKELRNNLLDKIDDLNNIKEKLIDFFLKMEE